MASRAGHHIPGTPYTYKHGWKLVSEEQTHTLVSVPVDDVLRSFANQGFLWRNTEDRRQLADSMRQHGFDPANPINVSPDIGMVDGHHRLQAAKDAGLKEVPIAFHKTHMSSAEQSERDNGLAYGGDSFYRSAQRRARQDREERQRASSPAARIAAASRAIKRHHKAITFLEEAAARLDAANEHDRAKAARVDAEVERTQKSNHEKELKAALREAMVERHKKRGQQHDLSVTPGGRMSRIWNEALHPRALDGRFADVVGKSGRTYTVRIHDVKRVRDQKRVDAMLRHSDDALLRDPNFSIGPNANKLYHPHTITVHDKESGKVVGLATFEVNHSPDKTRNNEVHLSYDVRGSGDGVGGAMIRTLREISPDKELHVYNSLESARSFYEHTGARSFGETHTSSWPSLLSEETPGRLAMRDALIERHKQRGEQQKLDMPLESGLERAMRRQAKDKSSTPKQRKDAEVWLKQHDLAVTPGGRVGDASPLARPGYKGGRKLSDYEREVAHALMRKGVPRQRAIIMARGIINKAAATGRWGKGKARPQVVAGAVASIAQRKAARVAHNLSADSGKVLDMAVLTTKKRKRLKKSQFALPAERKYPIPDRAHAANAKARVAQHGTTAQKKKVAAAVKAKFDMSTATVGELRRAVLAIKVAQARDIDLVGPKGYVHGWKFVGVPGGGVKIRRSRHGGSLAKTGAKQRLAGGKSPNVTKDLKTLRTRGTGPKAPVPSPKGSPTARLRKPIGLDAQMRDRGDGELRNLSHHDDEKISMAARRERIRRTNLSTVQNDAERQARMHRNVRRLINTGVGERRGTVRWGPHAPLPAGRKVTAHELSSSGKGEIRDAETGEILSSGHKSKLAATRIANAHNAHYGYGSVGSTPNQHSGTDPLAKAKNALGLDSQQGSSVDEEMRKRGYHKQGGHWVKSTVSGDLMGKRTVDPNGPSSINPEKMSDAQISGALGQWSKKTPEYRALVKEADRRGIKYRRATR